MPGIVSMAGVRHCDPIVIGALHSREAIATATSVLGRRTLRIEEGADVVRAVDHEDARALLFELGHPGFVPLATRLTVVGTRLPVVLLLPQGTIPAKDLLALSRIADFSLAYDHRELPVVLRRTMARGVASSDACVVAAALDRHLSAEAAALSLGLYVAGNRNATVVETRTRLGFSGALRNRLRQLGLARASTIMGWACGLGIVWRMENEECSLSEAARASGFDTTRQCSDRLLYHMRRTPTGLCERGFDALVGEFVEIVQPRNLWAA